MNFKYFVTPQCNACHSLEPKVQDLAKKYGIPVETIDLANQPEEKGRYLLFSAPALIIFDGEKEVKRFIRNFGLHEVEAFIKRVI